MVAGPSIPPSFFYRNQSSLSALISLHRDYLKTSGWLESKIHQRSQRSGRPIPWFTYSALHFLDSLDLSETRVLEIGGGASSLYWEGRAATVVTLESPGPWADAIEEEFTKPSSTLVRAEIGAEEFPPDTLAGLVALMKDAEVVVVDGGNRAAFLEMAALVPLNLLVVDNSDRSDLASSISALQSKGWIRLPFGGLGPLNSYGWETSIFFRSVAELRKLQGEEELFDRHS